MVVGGNALTQVYNTLPYCHIWAIWVTATVKGMVLIIIIIIIIIINFVTAPKGLFRNNLQIIIYIYTQLQ